MTQRCRCCSYQHQSSIESVSAGSRSVSRHGTYLLSQAMKHFTSYPLFGGSEASDRFHVQVSFRFGSSCTLQFCVEIGQKRTMGRVMSCLFEHSQYSLVLTESLLVPQAWSSTHLHPWFYLVAYHFLYPFLTSTAMKGGEALHSLSRYSCLHSDSKYCRVVRGHVAKQN